MPRRRLLAPVGLVLGASLALSGCSFGQLGIRAGSIGAASSATITVTPAPSATSVAPSAPVVVTVAQGRLTGVVVTGPAGAVPGALSVDGRTWTSTEGALDYAATYTVAAAAVDRIGLRTELSSTVTTVAPSAFVGYTTSPRAGATVGVGMPLRLTLDVKLGTPGARAAFEKRLAVTVDAMPAEGAWRWLTDNVVVYRPRSYWPGNAEVTLTSALRGIKITTSVWGESDRSVTFRTGPAMISYVDMLTKQMRVTKDGATVRTIPITTGKAGFETRSGIKVIMDKELTRIMDAATGGTDEDDPEYYRLEVEYAMRLTYSGEFLHAAPWSVRHQGRDNVSHGCTGMSTPDAAWLYGNSRIGDVVVYTGNDRAMESSNGIAVWNMSWARWQRGSALT